MNHLKKMIKLDNILSFNLIDIKNPVPQVGYKKYDYTIKDDKIDVKNGFMDFI